MTGFKATSEAIENNHVVQWTRIIATGMTLVDVPVGGVRALTEVGKLSREVEESAALARTGEASADAARARIAKIAHPAKHPGPGRGEGGSSIASLPKSSRTIKRRGARQASWRGRASSMRRRRWARPRRGRR